MFRCFTVLACLAPLAISTDSPTIASSLVPTSAAPTIITNFDELGPVGSILVPIFFSLYFLAFAISWSALIRFRKGYHVDGRMPFMIWGMQVGLIMWMIYLLVGLYQVPTCFMKRFSGFFFYPIFGFYWVRAFKLVFQWEIALKLNEFHSLPPAAKTTQELYRGRKGFFVKHRKWITPKYLYTIITVYIILHLLFAIANIVTLCPEKIQKADCGFSCAVDGTRLILLFVVELLMLVVLFCCFMRKGDDALKVKLELLLLAAFVLVGVIFSFLLFFIANWSATLTAICFFFTCCGCFTIWYPIVMDLRMNKRHEAKPPKFSLATILQDPAGFQSVAAFLKLEFSAENAYFYQRVEEYRDPSNRGEGAADYLYDTFIAPNSPYQINVSAPVVASIATRLGRTPNQEKVSTSVFAKTTIAQRIARSLSSTSALEMKTHGRTPSTMNIAVEDLTKLFDEAQAEVLQLMMRDSWVRYLQSAQFAEYARDHMQDAVSVVDNVEQKMRSSGLHDDHSEHSRTERTSGFSFPERL